MANRIYVGEIGTTVSLECGLDISAATVRRIYYTKPDGTSSYWSASASGTTAMTYTTTAATDIDQVGVWRLRAYVVTPTYTSGIWGDIVTMTVKPTSSASYALTTVDEAAAYIGDVPDKDAFWLYCNAADATAATAQINDLTATLIITGGTSAGTTTITFTTSTTNTISEMVAYINTVTGWAAGAICHADADTGDLIPTGAVSVLGAANETTFKIKDTLTVERLVDRATDLIERYTGRKLVSRPYTHERYWGNGTKRLVLAQYPVTRVAAAKEGRTSAFGIKNTTATSTAYVEVTDTLVRLTADGTTSDITIASYATITLLIAAIEAVSGWDCSTPATDVGAKAASELLPSYGARYCKGAEVDVEIADEYLDDYALEGGTDATSSSGVIYNPAGWMRGVEYHISYVAGYATIPYALEMACLELVKYKWDATKASGVYKSESLGDYSFTLADFAKGMSDDTRKTLDLFRSRAL